MTNSKQSITVYFNTGDEPMTVSFIKEPSIQDEFLIIEIENKMLCYSTRIVNTFIITLDTK